MEEREEIAAAAGDSKEQSMGSGGLSAAQLGRMSDVYRDFWTSAYQAIDD